ncbi:zinc finger protein 551 [Octopus bimaculoides]|uniref:zinc finger protein 551 n=1 Tax=Octopus bimaculoides TaxID=37653 RepID=UPI0022E45E2E|nr:zinc finger protein 551 [Octopus bimaculoides]
MKFNQEIGFSYDRNKCEMISIDDENAPKDEILFQCEICGKSFSTNLALSVHIEIHKKRTPLMEHMKVGIEQGTSKCGDCGKSLSDCGCQSKNNEISGQIYCCEVCEESFETDLRLIEHSRSHVGKGYHHCLDCGKFFLAKKSLMKHIRVHFGEEPYCCEICGKTFAQYGALTQHKVLHNSENEYLCKICSKSFSESCKLLEHASTILSISTLIEKALVDYVLIEEIVNIMSEINHPLLMHRIMAVSSHGVCT